jgi:hypothetical protein
MKLLSFALAVAAAVALLIGVAVRLAGRQFIVSVAPVTFWRLSVACLGFAIYLHLYAKDAH